MHVIGLAGWSGAGKTTLLERLIPVLIARGLSVSTIKHAHHAFDLAHPDTATFAWREAGAAQIMVASADRWALLSELRDEPEPGLPELLARMQPVDLVLIEGFKRWNHPKIEIHRAANGKPWLHPDDPWIAAIATDAAEPFSGLPACHLDDIAGIADMVQKLAVPSGGIVWVEDRKETR